MLKAICIVTLIISVGLMIYFVWNAIQTSKRNKAKSETHSRIFMAQIQKELQEKEVGAVQDEIKQIPPQPIAKRKPTVKQPLILTPEAPKSLNYDEYTDDVDVNAANGKRLKDFYRP